MLMPRLAAQRAWCATRFTLRRTHRQVLVAERDAPGVVGARPEADRLPVAAHQGFAVVAEPDETVFPGKLLRSGAASRSVKARTYRALAETPTHSPGPIPAPSARAAPACRTCGGRNCEPVRRQDEAVHRSPSLCCPRPAARRSAAGDRPADSSTSGPLTHARLCRFEPSCETYVSSNTRRSCSMVSRCSRSSLAPLLDRQLRQLRIVDGIAIARARKVQSDPQPILAGRRHAETDTPRIPNPSTARQTSATSRCRTATSGGRPDRTSRWSARPCRSRSRPRPKRNPPPAQRHPVCTLARKTKAAVGSCDTWQVPKELQAGGGLGCCWDGNDQSSGEASAWSSNSPEFGRSSNVCCGPFRNRATRCPECSSRSALE